MCSALTLGALWVTVTPRAELQGDWIFFLFAHSSCWDGGILGSVPSQSRADGGLDSQWLQSGGNKLEGRMWGSSGKGGIFHSRGGVRRMQQGLCRCQRSRRGQREIRRTLEKSHFHILASIHFFSSLSQKSPRLLTFHFPFLSLVSGCLWLRFLLRESRYYIFPNSFFIGYLLPFGLIPSVPNKLLSFCCCGHEH